MMATGPSTLLPEAILSSGVYRDLDERNRLAVAQRRDAWREIADDLLSELRNPSERVEWILEGADLDVRCLALRLDPNMESTWQVVWMWTSAAEPGSLAPRISRSALDVAARAVSAATQGEDVARDWLARWAGQVLDLADGFDRAESFEAAVAAMVQQDLLMSSLMSFAAAYRLATA